MQSDFEGLFFSNIAYFYLDCHLSSDNVNSNKEYVYFKTEDLCIHMEKTV